MYHSAAETMEHSECQYYDQRQTKVDYTMVVVRNLQLGGVGHVIIFDMPRNMDVTSDIPATVKERVNQRLC